MKQLEYAKFSGSFPLPNFQLQWRLALATPAYAFSPQLFTSLPQAHSGLTPKDEKRRPHPKWMILSCFKSALPSLGVYLLSGEDLGPKVKPSGYPNKEDAQKEGLGTGRK